MLLWAESGGRTDGALEQGDERGQNEKTPQEQRHEDVTRLGTLLAPMGNRRHDQTETDEHADDAGDKEQDTFHGGVGRFVGT